MLDKRKTRGEPREETKEHNYPLGKDLCSTGDDFTGLLTPEFIAF